MTTTFGQGTQVTTRALNTAFADLQAQITSAGGAPLGAIMMWAGTTANIPTGYAVCNGASLVKNDYLSLWNVIGYRYGGSGANFNLPDFLSRVPQGITTVAPVGGTSGTTFATSASSAVDVHTHTVNTSLTAGNAASHVHSNTFSAGSVNSSFSAGNAADHLHAVIGNTGNQSANHVHTYFKPNSGANNNTGGNSANHTHAMLFNSQAADRVLTVNSSFTAGNTNSSFTSGGVNTAIGVNTSLTAGNASTINSSTTAHTHTVNITQVIFIIKVV